MADFEPRQQPDKSWIIADGPSHPFLGTDDEPLTPNSQYRVARVITDANGNVLRFRRPDEVRVVAAGLNAMLAEEAKREAQP